MSKKEIIFKTEASFTLSSTLTSFFHQEYSQPNDLELVSTIHLLHPFCYTFPIQLDIWRVQPCTPNILWALFVYIPNIISFISLNTALTYH